MERRRTVVLGLGSNLGGRVSLLRAARDLLAHGLGGGDLREAPVWRTAPLGPPQPDYLNTAVALETDLSLARMLLAVQAIEAKLHRVRERRWEARTLDIDVLWHDGPPVHDATLDVPHRELRSRPFALAPLLALMPGACGEDGQPLAELPAAKLSPGVRLLDALGEGFRTEEVAHTADEGFRVQAIDRADLLAAAAEALGAIIVNPGSVAPEELRVLRVPCEGDNESRMVTWLSEVLYAVDEGRFAIRRVAVLDDAADHVEGLLLGAPLDESLHEVRTAVKAVTWHGLEVIAGDEAWRAQVIVDL